MRNREEDEYNLYSESILSFVKNEEKLKKKKKKVSALPSTTKSREQVRKQPDPFLQSSSGTHRGE